MSEKHTSRKCEARPAWQGRSHQSSQRLLTRVYSVLLRNLHTVRAGEGNEKRRRVRKGARDGWDCRRIHKPSLAEAKVNHACVCTRTRGKPPSQTTTMESNLL